MRRVGLIHVLGVIGVAIFVTLYLLPTTGWLVKVNVRAATGDLKPDGTGYSGERTYSVRSLAKSQFRSKPHSLDEKLYQVLVQKDINLVRKQLSQLSDEYPDNALVQGLLCRYASQYPVSFAPNMKSHGTPNPYPINVRTKQEFVSYFEKGATRGIKCDPKNLFFRFMKLAEYDLRFDDLKANQTINAFAETNYYNSFLKEELTVRQKGLVQSGYDGQTTRFVVENEILLPHVSGFRPMSVRAIHYFSEPQKTLNRVRLLGAFDCIQRTSSVNLEVIAGTSYVKRLCRIDLLPIPKSGSGYHPTPKFSRITDREWMQSARNLKAQGEKMGIDAKGTDILGAMEYSLRFTKAWKQNAPYFMDPTAPAPYSLVGKTTPWLFAIPALLEVTGLFLVGQALRLRFRFAIGVPILPAIAYGLMTPKDTWVLLLLAYCAGALLISYFQATRKWLVWVLAAAVLIGGASRFFTAISVSDHAWVIAALIVVGYAPFWITNQWAATFTGSAQVLVLTGFIAWFHASGDSVLVYTGLALSLTCGPRALARAWYAIGPAILVIAVGFGMVVRQQVALDKAFGQDRPPSLFIVEPIRKLVPQIKLEE